jgi:hypothetical protein
VQADVDVVVGRVDVLSHLEISSSKPAYRVAYLPRAYAREQYIGE